MATGSRNEIRTKGGGAGPFVVPLRKKFVVGMRFGEVEDLLVAGFD